MSTRIYKRVSKSDGSQTTDNQAPDIESLARSRGLIVDYVYDESASAAQERPQFRRMLAGAESGDTIIVWSLDRFGRSLAGNLDDLRRLWQKGVTVLSCREPWLEQPGSIRDLMVCVFSWVAEHERTRLVERTLAGLARAKAEGIRLGRPKGSHDIKKRKPRSDRGVKRGKRIAKMGGAGAATTDGIQAGAAPDSSVTATELTSTVNSDEISAMEILHS